MAVRERGSLVPGQCKIYVTESKRTDLPPSLSSIRTIIKCLGCVSGGNRLRPATRRPSPNGQSEREEIFRPTELENPSTVWPPGSGCGWSNWIRCYYWWNQNLRPLIETAGQGHQTNCQRRSRRWMRMHRESGWYRYEHIVMWSMLLYKSTDFLDSKWAVELCV